MKHKIVPALVTGGLAALLAVAGASAAGPEVPPNLGNDPEAAGFADLLFAHAMLDLAADDVASALPRLQRAAEIYPRDAAYRFFAGVCLTRLGRTDAAIAALEQVAPPKNGRVPAALVHEALGEAYYAKQAWPDAERSLRAAVAGNDRDARGHYLLGLTLIAANPTAPSSDAFAHIDKAVLLDPALAADGAYYRGVQAWRAGDAAGAKTAFATAARSAQSDLASSSQAWLTQLAAPSGLELPPQWEARVGLALEHDDNPTLLDPFVAKTLKAPTGSDDRWALNLRGGYAPLRRNDWTLGFVANGYASRNRASSAQDLRGIQALAQVAYGADPLGYANGPLGYVRVPRADGPVLGFVAQVGASHFQRDGSGLRRDVQGAASLVFQEHGVGKTQLDYVYDDITVAASAAPPGTIFEVRLTDQSETGRSKLGRLSQYFNLGDDPARYLKLSYEVGRTNAAEALNDFDRQAFALELAVPLGRRWALFLNTSHGRDAYDSVDYARHRVVRDEHLGTLAWVISPHLYVAARYGISEARSTADGLLDTSPLLLVLYPNYTRHVGSLSIVWNL